MLDIKKALNFIEPSLSDYESWLQIGMALKDASRSDPTISWETWDDWSVRDSRPGMYVPGQCEKKWNSFNSSGITKGTLIKQALDAGYNPFDSQDDFLEWDDVIEYDGEEPRDGETVKYLKALFHPDDKVNYVLEARHDKRHNKWYPCSNGVSGRTAQSLIDALYKYKNDFGAAFGDYNKEAGGWIRFNPMDGNGVKNSNVAAFRYTLIESDEIPVKEQLSKLYELKLPCAAIVHSGGKSVHAIVHIDADNETQYTQRVRWLYQTLTDLGFPVDNNNKNPSRLTRIPGLERGKSRQSLIDINTGLKSFADWEEYAKNGLNEIDLPEIESYADIIDNPPELKPELIEGVLRQSHKMIIAGASKSGKSFSLIDLMSCVAEGKEWLGFKCKKGRVLYINLEIDEASFWERIRKVYEAKGWNATPKNIDVWNLRGKAMSINKLTDKLIRRLSGKDYALVILDPIYKVQSGDENSAGDITKFTNEIDRIVTEIGCSIVYCHHHSKGMQGFKRSMDRSSGSGVFSRDADAIIDMIELSNAGYRDKERYKDKRAFRIEGTLREFPAFNPVNVFYEFPIFELDKEGILDNAVTLDEHMAKSEKASKKKSKKENLKERIEEFYTAFNILATGDTANANDLKNYFDIKSDRALRSRISEVNENPEMEGQKQIHFRRSGSLVIRELK